MVSQQGQVDLQRLPVLLLRLFAEELVEIALRGVMLCLWRHRLLALPQAEECSQDAREARRQCNGFVQVRCVIEDTGPTRAQGGHPGTQRVHRLGVLRQIPDHRDYLLRQFAVS